MPKSSSFRSAPVRSAPARAPAPAPAPAPAHTVQQSPLYAPPTIGQTLKESFAAGVGVSLATRAVSAVLGPPTVQMQTIAPAAATPPPPIKPCAATDDLRATFEACMRQHPTITECQQEFDAYRLCRQ